MNICWTSREVERSNAPAPLEHMFRQDLNSYCLPHSDTHHSAPYRVYIHGDKRNEALSWALIRGLSERNTRFNRDAFADAYRNIIMYIADRGEYTFAISENEDGHPALMLSRHRNYYRRYGPICVKTSPQPNSDWTSRKVVRCLVTTRGTWTLRLPRSIQSPAQYRAMTNALRSRSLGFGENVAGLFARGDAKVSDYTYLSDSHLLQTCKSWRWDGRLSSPNRINEFHRLFLNLSWRQNMAILREHVVKELNLLLKELGYGTRFGVCGLISSEQYGEALHRIYDKESGLDQAYDMILNRGKYSSYGRQD